MRTFLVPFHDDDSSDIALEAAHRLASRNAGHIEGLLVLENPALAISDRFAVPSEVLVQVTHSWREVADKARGRFRGFVERRGIAWSDEPQPAGEAVTAGWRELEGRESDIVGERARLHELTVFGRMPYFGPPHWEATAENLLFESGRPVLITGARHPAETLGDIVVIAWNRSIETARTVALGMPLLTRARRVALLEVEDWTFPGPSGEEMTAWLRRAGVNAEHTMAPLEGRTPGQVILAETDALGADLLFKGAYTRNRLRELVFGGATRHVLTHAELPVFMAH